MRKHAGRSGIRLPTENFVTVDRELIEQVVPLRARFFNERGQRSLALRELARMRLEVGMNADDVFWIVHVAEANSSSSLLQTAGTSIRSMTSGTSILRVHGSSEAGLP